MIPQLGSTFASPTALHCFGLPFVLGTTRGTDGALGDPLFDHKVTWAVAGIIALKAVAIFTVIMLGLILMIWFERRVVAVLQNRVGPNRTGPFGLLQTLADGLKLFGKEDLLPANANKRLFRLAPYLVAGPAFLSFAIVPFGGTISIFGHQTRLQLADPPVGVLWLLVMSSVSTYGVILAGWSSGSKYPLLGSVRASAQMISYEAVMGLSVAAVVLVTGALETSQIVEAQKTALNSHLPHWLHSWNLIALGVVPFVTFMIAATAELNRPPFDLTEAEQELVGGYMTEYSSMRFAMFYLAEFMNVITMSCVMVTLFFGGGDGPVVAGPAWLWSLVWFTLKLVLFLFTYVWIRATLPRLRYDALMNLCWKVLLPVSIAWLLIVAATKTSYAYGLLTIGLMVVAGVVLALASVVGKERYQDAQAKSTAMAVRESGRL